VADFVILTPKTAIYVDGAYWHSKDREKDILVTKELEETGWKVLRIDEQETKEAQVILTRLSPLKDPKVVKIEEVEGIEELYDAEAVKNHTLIANGIVVHNSGTVGECDFAADHRESRYSPISGTSMACLPPDTLIETMEGFKPIEEVHNPMVVPCYVDEKTNFGKVVSPVAVLQGLKKCCRLRTRYLELVASYDHPIFAVRKERMPNDSRTHKSVTRNGERKSILCGERRKTWLLKDRIEEIPLCELKPGDWILVKRRASFEGVLPDDCKDWTPDHWRLLGLCMADGYLNSRSRYRQVFWSQIKDDTRKYYMNALKSLGYDVKDYKGERFYVDSAPLLRIYQKLIGLGNGRVGWTLKVVNLPLDCLRYVVQGYLDGDGWATKDKNGLVQMGFSDSPENLRLLKLALMRFGIRTSVIKERRKGSKKRGNSGVEHYILVTGEDVDKFAKEIGSCVKKIPEKKSKPYSFKVGVRRFSEDYEFQRIEKIEEAGVQPVYDIRVDPDHNFIAEGVVVHNTPHVSGIIALMVQAVRMRAPWLRWDFQKTLDMLEKTATEPKSDDVGWGLIHWRRFEEYMETEYGVRI
jgi:intein/homing endonuclease